MDGRSALRRQSVASAVTRTQCLTAIKPFLNQLERNVKKLADIWEKFKGTPHNIVLLIRDLQLLSRLLIQTIQESNAIISSSSSVIELALRSCLTRSLELLELSSKYTGFLSRRSLTGDRLKNLQQLLADSKIKFLIAQLLLERYVRSSGIMTFQQTSTPLCQLTSLDSHLLRRTKPISQSALAEQLAQLSTEPQGLATTLQVTVAEPRTDSLLSFKCYSEIVGREDVLLALDRSFDDASLLVLVGPHGSG